MLSYGVDQKIYPMPRLILSIAGALAISFALVFATDALFHLMPSSAAVPADTNDREAMRLYVASQPPGLLAAMVMGWAAAAFAGSAFAARFAGRGFWPGWLVGGLFFAATAANFAMVSHPVWMVTAGSIGILAASWLGSRVGARPQSGLRWQRSS